jgi:hypothetical protein
MSVDEALRDLDPGLRRLAQMLRRVIKRSLQSAVEQVKWGNPVYSVNGKGIACIMCYSDHVNLGFFLGSKLTSTRLEGTGKGLRHIKVRSRSDIDEREFGRLLRKAVALAE